jgi:hypothetical protein
LEVQGIFIEDQRTWVRRVGVTKTFFANEAPCWEKVLSSSKLVRAVDDLVGHGNYNEFGCGWWIISFPGFNELPFGLDGKLHVDGYYYKHFPFRKELGLVPIMLFSDINMHGGGTVVAKKSHIDISYWLGEAGVRMLITLCSYLYAHNSHTRIYTYSIYRYYFRPMVSVIKN